MRRTIYSFLVQTIVFFLILILIKNYIYVSKINTIASNMIISDSILINQIGRYKILKNEYALDLELNDIGNERKLDSIKFVNNIDAMYAINCKIINNHGFKLCHSEDGVFMGISPIKVNEKNIGYVVSRKKYDFVSTGPMIYSLMLLAFTVIGVFLFNFIFLFLSMKKNIESNTKFLLDFISSDLPKSDPVKHISIDEYLRISQKFVEERSRMAELEKEKIYYKAKKNLAEQVAHDIRSPLETLKILERELYQVPEGQRNIIKNAIMRINDIANNLLAEYKLNRQEKLQTAEIRSEPIFLFLDSIISEKRTKFLGTAHKLEYTYQDSAIFLCANINTGEFKRVMSNLINNAFEAISQKESGKVEVNLTQEDNFLRINIKDNGCGIPAELLTKIMEGGTSVGKKEGSGIGVSSSIKFINGWGGDFEIYSKPNQGTTFCIILPIFAAPSWFSDKLTLLEDSAVYVLDDDEYIHEIWSGRLANQKIKSIKHFYKVDAVLLAKDELRNAFCLFDYELHGSELTGLEIIEKLALASVVLVTSRYEDEEIRSKCIQLGIKLLPKPFAAYVPIAILEKEDQAQPIELIFIDDDKNLTEAWENRAILLGKSIAAYNNPDDFLNEMHQYPITIPVYIDSNLGNGIKGEEFAKKIYDAGYKNIYLATGYPESHFDKMYWIKEIRGKACPF